MLIGIVGKPNVGKSTFFKALTLADVEIASRPFTTIKPNRGMAYVRIDCPEKDFGKKCNPRNSFCINGNRFVPVEIMDVAGLVPGAHKGRGLGNKFLDDLRQADAFIHIIDLSGRTDEEGNPTTNYNPLNDIKFLENELDKWFFSIIEKNWDTFVRRTMIKKGDFAKELAEIMSGLGIKYEHVLGAISSLGLRKEDLSSIDRNKIFELSSELRRISKPMLIVANKADIKGADENLRFLENYEVVVCSADIELALKEASEKNIISYIPGNNDFEIKSEVNDVQKKALEFMRDFLHKNNGSGVQRAINKIVLDILGYIVVFPVEDENKLTDKKGNVLPDAFLLPKGSKAIDLAYAVHTDIGNNFVRAVDCRTKRGIGRDYLLKMGDVIKIYSTH